MLVVNELPGPELAPGVLAGLDGSDGSLWALERAAAEAAALKLPLYALAGVNPVPSAGNPAWATWSRRAWSGCSPG
ncbi:hypothetical protein ACFQZC_17920 [Streptacidiphilus monticola]